MKPALSLILASTPRSGSYLLQDHLNATGKLGVCREFAPQLDKEHWGNVLGYKSYNDYLDRVVPDQTTSNGVFSVKFMWFQLVESGLTVSQLRPIASGRTVVIFLGRLDREAQAVSWVLARATGRWTNFGDSISQSRVEEAEASITDGALLEARRTIQAEYSGWLRCFSYAPADLYLDYETWVGNPSRVVWSIAKQLGIDVEQSAPVLTRHKMRYFGADERLKQRLLLLLR